MRKFILFTAALLLIAARSSYATIPTFDAVNAALNELRNSLMQSQFARNIVLAAEQLNQLRASYFELIRFNSGIDDFMAVFAGDDFSKVFHTGNQPLMGAFNDFGWITADVATLESSSNAIDLRTALENITGSIPLSDERPYIPFEEMHVVQGFQLAQMIRNAGDATRAAANSIAEQAVTASPKGAARLTNQALSQVLLLSQQSQETMAKLIELEAVQVEQVSRDEKRLESERLKYLGDAQNYIDMVAGGTNAG